MSSISLWSAMVLCCRLAKGQQWPQLADCCLSSIGQGNDIAWSDVMRSGGQLSRDLAVCRNTHPFSTAQQNEAATAFCTQGPLAAIGGPYLFRRMRIRPPNRPFSVVCLKLFCGVSDLIGNEQFSADETFSTVSTQIRRVLK